jgi:hypothetical protein
MASFLVALQASGVVLSRIFPEKNACERPLIATVLFLPAGNSPERAGASPTPLTPGDDDDDEDEAADLDAAGLDLTMQWMVVREGAGKRESAKYDVNNHACACLVFF